MAQRPGNQDPLTGRLNSPTTVLEVANPEASLYADQGRLPQDADAYIRVSEELNLETFGDSVG